MSYPSGLMDEKRDLIRPFVEYPNEYRNHKKHPIGSTINTILYVFIAGCQKRSLPIDIING